MMTKIDTSNWKKFIIGQLFEPLETGYKGNGKKIGTATTVPDDIHIIPLTAAKNDNNGIMYWGRIGDYITYSNIIAVIRDGAVSTGRIFAQETETGTYSHSYFIKVKEKNISFATNLFLSRILETVIYPKYTRDDSCIWERIKDDEILLPVDSLGNPDWDYMSLYMKKLLKESEKYIDNLRQINDKKKKIDITNWKEFVIEELFEKIVKPDVLHSRQVTECDNGIPYVVRTKFNNGIKCYVEKKENMKLSPRGVISFGAENATFFYQDKPFVSGRDIYYIDTQHLNANTCKFLVACLQPIARKYSYNNGLFPDLLKREIIKLPVCMDGKNPDWDYMEQYMKNIMNVSEKVIKNFKMLSF